MKTTRYNQYTFHEVKKKRPKLDGDVHLPKTKSRKHCATEDEDSPYLKLKDKKHRPPEEVSADLEKEDDQESEDDKDEEDDREDGKEKEPSSHGHITHGYHLIKGKMGHGMEDYVVAEKRKMNGYELGLYAIFDGHSGQDVAKYLQSHLFDNILNELDFWTKPKHAIKRAYEKTNNDILERVVGSRGGSTAVTAIVINGKKLIVANVGDSRAVLCKRGAAKQITVDHEPQKEKGLVESKGGFVSKKPGNVDRVDGQLAMTRAFGDGKLKDHITAEPDVRIVNVDADTEFAILASDGLWKVMSNEEAFESIKEKEDAQEASEELVDEALSRKSCDDISCIVVRFNQSCSRKASTVT